MTEPEPWSQGDFSSVSMWTCDHNQCRAPDVGRWRRWHGWQRQRFPPAFEADMVHRPHLAKAAYIVERDFQFAKSIQVGEENPVRAVEAFVEMLDLRALGFAAVDPSATGRPGYHPAVLLKLYIYGYLNAIASSRRLEREAGDGGCVRRLPCPRGARTVSSRRGCCGILADVQARQ
jgi:hypothetical protein